MVTGDAPATAAVVAHAVGLAGQSARRGHFPPVLNPRNLRSSQAFCPKGNMTWSRPSKMPGTRSACAATAPTMHQPCASTNRHCRLDGHGRCQIGGRRCADSGGTGRHCGGSKGGESRLSAYSELHAAINHQQDGTSALVGNRSYYDRTCRVDPDAHGHRDDYQ